MSAILLIVIGLLLLGATLTFFLARYRLGYTVELGFVILSLALIAWLIAGQNLTLSVTLSRWTELPAQRQWDISANFTNWPLMFAYLLLMLSAQLVAMARKLNSNYPSTENSQDTTLSLLTCAVLFIYLGGVTLEALLVSQGALIIIWIILLYSLSVRIHGKVEPTWGIAGLLLGLLFLWLAGAVVGNDADFSSGEMTSPSTAATLIMLAGIFQLGVSSFYWWRLTDRVTMSQTRERHLLELPLYIAPAVAGVSLMTRLALPVNLGTPMFVLAAATGISGLILGVFVAWQDLNNPKRTLAAAAFSHNGLVLFVSLWAGTAAFQAAFKVQILAIGGLLISLRTSRPRPAWYWLVPLLSLIGVPFTAGFLSWSSLLQGLQLDGLQVAGVLVVALSIPIVIAMIAAFFGDGPVVWFRGPADSRQLLSDVAMLLLFLGLVSNPTQIAAGLSFWVWFLIVITVLSGFAAALNMGRILSLRARLSHVLDWRPAYSRSTGVSPNVLSTGRRAIQLAVRLLEGEGGLLWIWVLITALILIGLR